LYPSLPSRALSLHLNEQLFVVNKKGLTPCRHAWPHSHPPYLCCRPRCSGRTGEKPSLSPVRFQRLWSPPWSLMMPCTTESPIPVPSPGPFVVKKGSKMRSHPLQGLFPIPYHGQSASATSPPLVACNRFRLLSIAPFTSERPISSKPPFSRHRVGGIGAETHQHLMNLGLVAHDRIRFSFDAHSDINGGRYGRTEQCISFRYDPSQG